MKDSLVVAAPADAVHVAPWSVSLLDVVAAPTSSQAALRDALVFAFATGDAGDVLDRAVDEAPLGPSSWQPEDFADDVFLSELIAECLTPAPAHGRGALIRRVLTSPPIDVATALFRQQVFAELIASPALRARGAQLLAALAAWRALLARPRGVRVDALERRLAVLRAVRDVVVVARTGFEGATSGLGRVDAWANAVASHTAFGKLVDLLSYEECAVELDVRLRLGVDGKIRDFDVVERRAARGNPFYRSVTARLVTKLGLLLRGERFDDHELLARLVDGVFEAIVPLLPSFFALTAGLEFYVAGLAFHDAAARAGLPIAAPVFAEGPGGDVYSAAALWNPLLLSKSARVVTSDVDVARPEAPVIVTGPNSGGKTRLLQAIALTQILAQSGMFVPAASARLPWASGMFVSLLEHARADQAEGTLGTELLRIRRLFERVRSGSLVVLDELCSGTNPVEGEEIFRLVVKLLGELRPVAFITTHFLRFAARLAAEATDGAGAPALEFLRAELGADDSPTFRFVPGVAATSLAARTATRLGVTEEGLRAAIRARNPEG